MLTPELAKKIRHIHITTSRMVDAMMAGQYRSVFRGAGIEFEEVREYAPGDEVKSIDWKVTARMGRPYVKRYREERELTIMAMVDMSASGGFGTTESLKREKAAELASVVAFSAIRNNDKIGVCLFTDHVERFIPPKKGAAHVWRVIREILDFTPEHRGTDLAQAADFMGKVLRKRSVCFVISDFFDAGYLDSLKRFGKRHDVIAAMITDPGDVSLPEGGILETRDMETGKRMLLDCADRETRERFRREREAFAAETRGALAMAGLDCVALSTDQSSADVLAALFRKRERRAR